MSGLLTCSTNADLELPLDIILVLDVHKLLGIGHPFLQVLLLQGHKARHEEGDGLLHDIRVND